MHTLKMCSQPKNVLEIVQKYGKMLLRYKILFMYIIKNTYIYSKVQIKLKIMYWLIVETIVRVHSIILSFYSNVSMDISFQTVTGVYLDSGSHFLFLITLHVISLKKAADKNSLQYHTLFQE